MGSVSVNLNHIFDEFDDEVTITPNTEHSTAYQTALEDVSKVKRVIK